MLTTCNVNTFPRLVTAKINIYNHIFLCTIHLVCRSLNKLPFGLFAPRRYSAVVLGNAFGRLRMRRALSVERSVKCFVAVAVQ